MGRLSGVATGCQQSCRPAAERFTGGRSTLEPSVRCVEAEVMSEAIRTGTPAQIWQALVKEAGERNRWPLDETHESYLVFLLLRYQREPWLLSRVYGLDWMEALQQVGTARAESLREVGDRCLVVAGLFPELAERRRVSVEYFMDIGRSAYQGVADASRQAYAALYGQLSQSYRELVETLRAMRLLSGPELIRVPRGGRV